MAKRKLADDSPNSGICDMLNELAEYEKNINRSTPKFKVYKKAMQAIAGHSTKITSGAEAKKLDGVGTKIGEKIDEFLSTGKLERVEKIRADESHVAMSLLTKVTGIGPAAAQKLYKDGITSLDELRNNLDKLNHHQKIGVKYLNDFNQRIPREEVEDIFKLVAAGIKEVDEKIEYKVCGSYRRGAATCGDVDVLITHPDYMSQSLKSKSGLFLKRVVDNLSSSNILIDTLSHGESKYMGVCVLPSATDSPTRIHRRIDIRIIPKDQYFCGLLYFTGSDTFNQSMRAKCLEEGFTLNEYSLRKMGSTGVPGEHLPITCERDIFDFIGMDYVEPEDRKS
ncbi:DNA polymerase beta-like isoform X1 [Oopsacas minuta]|uniref:DNA polymerase n=1 Tax=Oopsacas minuta TaxID=111878 RepID=A0AAV7JAL2_9METZ|nr:DNA polymerase beta-like isoform X1 [Oopsacas minuta]